ncbi:MAG: hypothetical protein WC139_05375 [Candidatus Kapaibacterium sp.]
MNKIQNYNEMSEKELIFKKVYPSAQPSGIAVGSQKKKLKRVCHDKR